jgi:hypothetical protein
MIGNRVAAMRKVVCLLVAAVALINCGPKSRYATREQCERDVTKCEPVDYPACCLRYSCSGTQVPNLGGASGNFNWGVYSEEQQRKLCTTKVPANCSCLDPLPPKPEAYWRPATAGH